MTEEDIEDTHGDFGTVSEEDNIVDAGSSDIEMDISEEGGIQEPEVNSKVQKELAKAAETDEATQYDSHIEAIEAATGQSMDEIEGDREPSPEDFNPDYDSDDYNDDKNEEESGTMTLEPEDTGTTDTSDEEVEEAEVEESDSLPEPTSEDVGMDDGEMDFSALKTTEKVTETVVRNGNEFEFVFREPEESDDEIINMVRGVREGNDVDNIDESKAMADLRRKAVKKTLVKPDASVVDEEWDDFAGSVKLQLGGRALQVLGLMDFIRASGAGPELQQEG